MEIQPGGESELAEKPWETLKLTRREGDRLIYEIRVNEKTFSELYFRFEGKAFEPSYQRLVIFAESRDLTLCYNEDPRYPKHYVLIHSRSGWEQLLLDTYNPQRELYRQRFLASSRKPEIGTPSTYHIPFDLKVKDYSQSFLGGAVIMEIIKKYIIVIELQPDTESHSHQLFIR
jgi:hypothetical protein